MLSLLSSADAAERLSPPVWQIGEFFVDGGEFTGAAGEEVGYTIAEPARPRSVPIPQKLVGPGAAGCRRLRLTFSVPAGCYGFVRSVKRPGHRVAILGQVFLNGREAASYFTTALPGGDAAGPASRPAEDYQRLAVDRPGSPLVVSPPDYQCVVYPFVCLAEGRQEIVVALDAEINKGLSLELDALAVVPWTLVPRPHSLSEEVPGRVFLDAWGWMGTSWYQRSGPVDMAYFENKLIAESADRGSNYLQVHPSLDQARWSNGGIEARPLLRAIHARDMLVDEHCFPPKSAKPEQPASRARRRAAKAGQTDREDETAKPQRKVLVSPQVILDWFAGTWARLVADVPAHGWTESVDGFEGEALNQIFEAPAQLKRAVDRVWQSNPGLWMSHASFPCGPVWLSEPKYRTPNYLKSPVCLHFLGMSLGPPEGGRVGIVGYDDKMPYLHPFPGCEGLHPSAGKMFLGYQADCRFKGTEIIRRPSRWIGGGSSADWVLKQVDDFFRPRARWPDEPHETAIWWLGEPVETLPQEYRDYIYAITQDPIKHALATTHSHGGIGGFLEQREARLRQQAAAEKADLSEAEWWKLRRREEFPADTHFIQNAYLRLNLSPAHDGGVLQYDLERLGHFDSDGLNVPLTASLLAARGEAADFSQKLEIEQRGGHLAVLTARAQWTAGGGGRITEERRFSIVNDAPYLVLDLARNGSGVSGSVDLALGAEGYDLLLADGKPFDRDAQFTKGSLPKTLHFRHSKGVKPELVIVPLDTGGTSSIRWKAGKSVSLSGPADDQLRLAWVVPTDLYDANAMAELAVALNMLIHTVRLDEKGTDISNPAGVSYVAVARIDEPGRGPYLVRENGWWTVRGAQRSLLGGNQPDYVKVYLPAGGTSRLLPYGLIDGAAKPGYGCQYTVALRDVRGESDEATCKVRVLSVTPFIFAPRVEFARPIAKAELDGRPWHYFEDKLLFLPNLVGDHRIRVTYGQPSEPGLIRTFACVRKTGWNGSVLELEVADPPWSGPLPEDVFYYAFLRAPAGPPKSAHGAELLDPKGDFQLLRFHPGVLRLTW
ncbi:MAG: hypothetical protein HY718_06815 [Planctomycetes bacterium]|nr:hypothetical protein [Planctomycetota bacterium]